MKRLYLVRHAKSSWKDDSLADFDRPLNSRGKRDAPFMGKLLASEYQIAPDVCVSSPAKRAAKTAKILASEIGFPKKRIVYDKNIYEADVPSLLEVLHGLDEKAAHVMLVGHNPGLTNLAEYLADMEIGTIPTCGIFGVEFMVDGWQNVEEGKGHLMFFEYPKKHQ